MPGLFMVTPCVSLCVAARVVTLSSPLLHRCQLLHQSTLLQAVTRVRLSLGRMASSNVFAVAMLVAHVLNIVAALAVGQVRASALARRGSLLFYVQINSLWLLHSVTFARAPIDRRVMNGD